VTPYTIGCAILGAATKRKRWFVIGGDVSDQGKVYTDKATVQMVQRQLHGLALATGNKDFDPYSDGYKDDGVLGSRTQLSVMAFNQKYGWSSDGKNITDGTLEALKRPDVVDPKGYAAKQAAYDAASATTAQDVQAAAAKVAAVAPPAVKAQAHAAAAAAQQATTPAQVASAKQSLMAAAGQIQRDDEGPNEGMRTAGILFAGAAAIGLSVIGYHIVMRGAPKRAYR